MADCSAAGGNFILRSREKPKADLTPLCPFKRAMKDWKWNGSGAMPVHIMGHYLYSRYLDNSEGLDRDIVSRLSGIG